MNTLKLTEKARVSKPFVNACLVQYPKTDRRNEENLMPPLTPADGDHSTRETPNRSSGFALRTVYV
jgi:hypothetical protein